ncbi:MAG: signal peptidase I [Candidatus Kariarchaeaceae archaeon]
MKIKKEILDYLYVAIFGVALVSFWLGLFASVSPYSMVVIDNPDPNSMWPTYFQGDLFILHDVEAGEIELGDVIVYEKANKDKIIHRVIDIVKIDGLHYFRVKGDNPISNSTPDRQGTSLISEETVLGIVDFRIPHLGHLSLAMQRNAAIQLFVYFIAVLLGIAIFFWPEDEDKDKEDEFIDLTLNSIRRGLIGLILLSVVIYQKLKNYFRELKISQHRMLYMSGYILLLVLILLPVFIASITPIPGTPDGIGIKEINSSRTLIYNESIGGQNLDYSFTQVEITIYDSDGFWNRVKGFTLDAYTDLNNPGTLISRTKWNNLRDFKGIITVGASLVIDSENIPNNSSTIYLVATLEWVEFFSEKSREYNHEIIYGD